ncbi:hypothetical protein FOXG_06102 [Fusarium oxysporum f. sp. lycopersici 4287]|uniref:Uncharacterized protein n=3 Tax=Fusarium oxysporum TaxID=5507 RepID=A0A0J9UX47_FUSO4|nr:hypothetical protein FOXG_06102 [Fusarium oxysporum f. sp. lycopersici 4287]EXK33289.1 hypothetical protein FOMG_12006 [Fusarium oxysporum f. sp. melonis 26406]KAJ9423301.1 hypothetical protein QL093DRAFT_2575979 [Fusarium oxysporum]KNB03710.1 hypothetical protein FOXG_06102 [Fusarium oxysporum f. sp. lycopersici 4287]
MRLTDTILVALLASLGLALVLPKDDIKKEVVEHKYNDADPHENNFHGYEKITKITSHRYYGPKDHKHHHEEKEYDDDDDDDDDKEEHVHHSHKVKEKHKKYGHHHKSKKHDDDHKKHHSHDFKKKQHDHGEEDEEEEEEDKERKLIFHTDEFKKAKKKTEEKFPFLKDLESETPKSYHKHKVEQKHDKEEKKEAKKKYPFLKDVVLETPKRYHKHKYEQKHDKEEKKEQTNSKDGKLYKFIHRGGMDVKRDVDINIHAPTYEIHHDSDKKHDHGDAKLVKIFRVSSQESTHETKYPKYEHDDEQKHKKPTKEYHSLPKSLYQDGKSKHSDELYKENQTQTAKKAHSLLRPHREHIKSKHYDSHDKGHFGSEKKYPQSSKGHNHTEGHCPKPVVEATKRILDLIDLFFKKDNGHHGSPKKPSYQYKSYPSHDYYDKDHPNPHNNRYPDDKKPHSRPSKDTHHHYKPKNGYKKSNQAEDRQIGEEKKKALQKIIESLLDLLPVKKAAPEDRSKKSKPSEDDQDSYNESEKEHHSHERPSYLYKEHAEYKHDDNKKHIKLSEDRSSHYEPGYKHQELDSHHDEKKNGYDHDHEDSEKGQYSHDKPISQYKKKFDYKHDDEKKHIQLSKDHVSQHKPTYHYRKPDHQHDDKDHEQPKRPEPHHDDQEAEHHGGYKKSKDHYSYDKPRYQYKEHSEYKHDDDSERGSLDQRVKLDRKHIDHYRKSGHHKDHEDETKAYKDHQSRREPHAKRSNKLVPKLNTTQILNLEALKPQDRKRLAMGLPLDEQTRKEFGEFKDCTPKLITKLNAMYATIVDDPKYAPFIKYINTERKFSDRKRSASELTPEMLAKIEAMDPMIRGIAADQLDFDAKLKKEFVSAGKLYPGLIKKLEKEYARIVKDPKYKKILEKLKSHGKRSSPPKIPNRILKKIEAMDPVLRRVVAEKLDLPAKLTDEFVDCGKLDQHMIHKLNWEYARIYNDPKYKEILQEFNTKSKRSKGQDENTQDELKPLTKDEMKEEAKFKEEAREEVLASEPKRLTPNQLSVIGRMPKVHRDAAAKKLDLPKDLRKWFVKNKVYKGENLEQLNHEWIRVQSDPQYADIVKQIKALEFKGFGEDDQLVKDKAKKKIEDAAKKKAREKAEGIDKIRKRSVHQLTEKQLESLLKLDKYERQALARKLELDQSLAYEFVNTSKLNPVLIEKFNEAVSKDAGTPQHQELLKLVGQESPKPKEEELKLESIKKEVRLEIAKSLEFDEFTREEFLEAKELDSRLLDKVTKFWGLKRMKTAEQGKKDDLKHSEVVNKLLESALEKERQEGEDPQRKDTDDKKLTEADQKMKEKLEKTKANGWCDEFVSELEDAWGTKKKKTEDESGVKE